MICEARLHSTRAIGPAIAVQLMRVDNPCRGEAMVVALCQTCYQDNLRKIQAMYYTCEFCGRRHSFRDIWAMIGNA